MIVGGVRGGWGAVRGVGGGGVFRAWVIFLWRDWLRVVCSRCGGYTPAYIQFSLI